MNNRVTLLPTTHEIPKFSSMDKRGFLNDELPGKVEAGEEGTIIEEIVFTETYGSPKKYLIEWDSGGITFLHDYEVEGVSDNGRGHLTLVK